MVAKMSTLIIESCEKRIDENSTTSIVHVKNSLILKNYLNCDFVSHESEIDAAMQKQYNNIICAYSSPYMKYNKYVKILNNNPNANMYWLVNDHDIEDSILLRKWLLANNKPYNMICNNPRNGYRGWILRKKINGSILNDWIKDWHTFNLNVLIFDLATFYETYNCNKEGIIYYGTYRKHRIKDMLDYNNVNYFLSSSAKNHKKYQDAGVNAKFIEKLIWEEKNFDMFEPVGLRLRDYKYSIYFEDEHTHTNYAYMANRFYECLMNNVLMFFDARCNLVIEKSGYNIDPFQIVANGNELLEKMEILNSDQQSYKNYLQIQRSNVPFIKEEKQTVLNEISKVLQ
jgi:hypothetical protein